MNIPIIKVIITDFDGTLANNDRVVFSQSIAKMEECLDAGLSIAVASARPFGYLKYIFEDRLFSRIWKICHNGAQVFSPENLIVFKNHIDDGVKVEFLNVLASGYKSLSWYQDDVWFTDNSFSEDIRSTYGISPDYPGPVKGSFINLRTQAVEKILVVNAQQTDSLMEQFGTVLTIHKSRTEELLMVSSGSTDKASASEAMLNILGVTWQQTAAIGDDMNDASLLSQALFSFAVVDAPLGLKKLATFQVGSNNDPDTISSILDSIVRFNRKFRR